MTRPRLQSSCSAGRKTNKDRTRVIEQRSPPSLERRGGIYPGSRPANVSSHARSKKRRLAERAVFSFAQYQELLAEVLLAVCATERGAGRTGKAIASRIGLPVAAAIAVAVIVVIIVVAIIEG